MVKRYLLGVGVIIGIFAFNSTSAYADDVNMSVNLAASSTLILPSTPVNLAIEPTVDGRFSSGSFNVTAYSNSPAGYTLTMTTTSVDLTSDTYNAATETYPVISTLSDSVTASTFELNKWGISLDGGATYVPMTTERTLVDTTSTGALANGEVTTIGIGAKLDLETVPGKYSTTINFLLVAQPLPHTLDYMYGYAGKSKVTVNGRQYYALQDMETSICENADIVPNGEIQVVDKRDNNLYGITKLKDGNCWLLDNLSLNLLDSNVQSAMDSSNTNASDLAINALFNGGRSNGNNYANGGVTVFGNSYSDRGSYSVGNVYVGSPLDPQHNDGEELPAWRIGVYYNYCAASAGWYCDGDGMSSGSSLDPANSAIDTIYDICPANWRLPTGGEVYADIPDSGEVTKLLNEYPDVGELISVLHLSYNGAVDPDQARAVPGSQGLIGFYWTSTSGGYRGWYYRPSNSSKTVTSAVRNVRYHGYGIRCIAK